MSREARLRSMNKYKNYKSSGISLLHCCSRLSPGNQIPWCQVVNKKRELFPGLLPTSPIQLRYRKSGPKGPEYPRSGSEILTQFPFDKRPMIGHFETEFPYLLGSTKPMSNCCSHGTFLHFGLQSSHLNICYDHQDLH